MRNRGMKSLFQMHDRAVLTKISESKARTAQPGKIVTPSGPVIQKPTNKEVEIINDPNTKKQYQLLKSYTPNVNYDDIFQFNTYCITNNSGVFNPTAGNKFTFFKHRVPKSISMIITGFSFFLICNDEPIGGGDTHSFYYARPYEFFNWIAFYILVNGAAPLMMKNHVANAGSGVITEVKGWRVMSQDPERDSRSSPLGFAIKLAPSSLLEIVIENDTSLEPGGYSYTGVRNIIGAGCFLRGFYSDERTWEK